MQGDLFLLASLAEPTTYFQRRDAPRGLNEDHAVADGLADAVAI